MCQKVTCRRCGKATFSGCGQHVEQVLRGVAAADRCACASTPRPTTGFWARLTGRA